MRKFQRGAFSRFKVRNILKRKVQFPNNEYFEPNLYKLDKNENLEQFLWNL